MYRLIFQRSFTVPVGVINQAINQAITYFGHSMFKVNFKGNSCINLYFTVGFYTYRKD